MSLSGSKSRLSAVTKDLWMEWEQARNHWQDAKAREFHNKYMQDLFISVEKTITVIEKLDELLKKVRKDCE